MRRVAVVIVGLIAWALLRGGPSGGGPSRGGAPVRGPAPARVATNVVSHPAPEGAPPPRDHAFVERIAQVRRSCGLPVETLCDGGDCVAVTIGPDLDGLSGWLTLGLTSPRFVVETIGRDLGVPRSLLPCGAAVEGLDGPILAVEMADGTEMWCTGDAPWLCDRAAAARFGVVGFEAPGVRTLRF